MRAAKGFVGLPYLWAGLSGFGLDCSGLTWLTYRVHGIQTPRDALPQSQGGTPVRRARRGDLMFYATDGLVHHVSEAGRPPELVRDGPFILLVLPPDLRQDLTLGDLHDIAGRLRMNLRDEKGSTRDLLQDVETPCVLVADAPGGRRVQHVHGVGGVRL